MQFVRVEVSEGRVYTYQWDDIIETLEKGDRVILPSNMVHNREFEGRVVRLLKKPDTDYPLKDIIRKADDPLL